MQDETSFLEIANNTVRELVLKEFKADSCHANTRILIDVLNYFGVTGIPVPVEVTIFNNEAWNSLTDKGLEAVAKAIHARQPEEKGGPWTVGVGIVVNNNPTGGHVVVGVPSEHVILDGSLDQASRPNKDIYLKPYVIQTEDSYFFTEPNELIVTEINEKGLPPVFITYRHSTHKQYLNSPNWKGKTGDGGTEPFKRITGQAIRNLRDIKLN